VTQNSLTSPHPRITTSEDPPTSCLGSKHDVPNRHPYYSQSIHPKLSPTLCSFGQCESHSAVINGPSQHPNPSAATPYDPTTHPDYSHPTPSYARVYVYMSLYYEAHVLINHNTVSSNPHYLGGSIRARHSAESHARSLKKNTHTHTHKVMISFTRACNEAVTLSTLIFSFLNVALFLHPFSNEFIHPLFVVSWHADCARIPFSYMALLVFISIYS